MAGLQYVQRLFSLDTLDTRFTASSKASSSDQLLSDPARAAPNEVGYNTRSREDGDSGLSASRWSTPEFTVYGVVILIAIPLMFKSAYDVSNRTYALILIESMGSRTTYRLLQ